MQNLEHNEFFEHFIQIPEICQNFDQRFGLSIYKFRDITLAIKRIALSNETAVASMTKHRLVSKLKKISKCSKSEIEKVLDIFILKRGDPIFARYIFFDGLNCTYSWSMITYPIDNMMANLYDNWVDSNRKGVDFEKDCRNILKSQLCNVFKDRLLLKPLNTDLDVLAHKDNIFFTIECKAEVKREKRKDSQINKFQDYYQKLLLKTKWISENFKQFSEILSENSFSLPENIAFVVPILVTRFQILGSQDLITLSMEELKQVVSKSKNSIKHNSLQITLDSGSHIQFPIFKIKNSRIFD